MSSIQDAIASRYDSTVLFSIDSPLRIEPTNEFMNSIKSSLVFIWATLFRTIFIVPVSVEVQPRFFIELLPLQPKRISLLLLLLSHPPIEKGFVARIFEVFVDVREVPFDPCSCLEGVKESIDRMKAVGRRDRQRQIPAIAPV